MKKEVKIDLKTNSIINEDTIYVYQETFNIVADNYKIESLDERVRISMDPKTSLEEIRFKTILDSIYTHPDYIFISYVCKFNENLTQEFIEELLFISSEIFDFDYYNKRHIDAFVELIGYGGRNRIKLAEKFNYLKENQKELGLHDSFINKIDQMIIDPKGKGYINERVAWNDIKERTICSKEFFKTHSGISNSFYTGAPFGQRDKYLEY